MIDVDNDATFTAPNTTHNYGRFYREWVRNKFMSNKEGREVGEWRDFILIICPGQQKTEVRRQAKEEDKLAFPAEWRAYADGKEQIATGTPINLLPGIEESRAAMYKALYVMTIEQLAGLSDTGLQKAGMGASEDRARAQKYLQGAGSVRRDLEAATAQIAELRAQIAALQAQASAPAAAPRPRGRPRKDNGGAPATERTA